jgi:hypothetical protein
MRMAELSTSALMMRRVDEVTRDESPEPEAATGVVHISRHWTVAAINAMRMFIVLSL